MPAPATLAAAAFAAAALTCAAAAPDKPPAQAPAPAAEQKPAAAAAQPVERAAQPAAAPAPAPAPAPGDLAASIRRGVDFLLATQNADGSWGSARRTKGLNIYAPLPGAHHAFKAGAACLALSGLIDAADPRPAADAAIERGAAWATTALPELRRADQTTTYNTWGHAYGLRALCRLARRHPDDQPRHAELRRLAQQQVDLLGRYEDVNGGWGYLDFEFFTRKPTGIPTSFGTATVLLAMDEARTTLGVALDDKLVRHSLDSIVRQRTPDFAYTYSHDHRLRPRLDINQPAGSLARSQACNATLRRFGDAAVTDEVIERWAGRFLEQEPWFDIARKRPVPHESKFRISGYFYYYGVYYFTEAARLLPAERHAPLARRLAALVLKRQEKDGSWWDYPLYDYHQPYGTGYALMALAWCREAMREAGGA